jgi:isoleucyl-tRNA synthetase
MRKGRKMSKSLGNIVQPWDVLNVHGADALRWYLYTATPPGQERRFSSDLVGEVIRNFTLTLWNVYSFFITYANLDKPQGLTVTATTNDLDRWLLSELNVLVRDVTKAYDEYDVTNATRPVEKFVENLSTWYVRRSRRRFWKNDSRRGQASRVLDALHRIDHGCQVDRACHALPRGRVVSEPRPLGG